MSGFAIPLVAFMAFLALLLCETIRGSIDDPVPRRAGVTWALTLPLAGVLFGVGMASLAIVPGAISVLALGSLAHWFLTTEADDGEGEVAEPVEPEPGPSDDLVVEPPQSHPEPVLGIDWDAFDRARADWEREPVPVSLLDQTASQDLDRALAQLLAQRV